MPQAQVCSEAQTRPLAACGGGWLGWNLGWNVLELWGSGGGWGSCVSGIENDRAAPPEGVLRSVGCFGTAALAGLV